MLTKHSLGGAGIQLSGPFVPATQPEYHEQVTNVPPNEWEETVDHQLQGCGLTDALRRDMKRVADLRRRGSARHLKEWERIAEQVSRLNSAAAERLQRFGVSRVELHDGWVTEVVVRAATLEASGAELLRCAPRIKHVRITDYREVGQRLFSSLQLRSMHSLGLRGGELTDADVTALTATTLLTELRWLDLGDNEITDAGVEALARADNLDQLVFVALDGNPCRVPVDDFDVDAINGAILSTHTTARGEELERLSSRSLPWLHAPANFGHVYPPEPGDANALFDVVHRPRIVRRNAPAGS